MAFIVKNITIAATSTPQRLVAPATGSSLEIAWMEIGFDPAIGHDTYIGDASVSSTNYAIKLPANGTVPRIIANGPNAIKIDNLSAVYVSGTQGDILHLYVLTL